MDNETNVDQNELELEETEITVSDTVRVLALSAATTVAIMAGPSIFRNVSQKFAERKLRKAEERLAAATVLHQE